VDEGAWCRLKALVRDPVSSLDHEGSLQPGPNEFFVWYGQESRPGFTKATVAAWRVALEARGLGAAPSTCGSRQSGRVHLGASLSSRPTSGISIQSDATEIDSSPGRKTNRIGLTSSNLSERATRDAHVRSWFYTY